MPTPSERAYAVVEEWSRGLGVPTDQLGRLVKMVAGAIDAQVADWMASQPRPNGWDDVAKTSHVVAHEPGKAYQVAPVVVRGPAAATGSLPPCPHTKTSWGKENRYLVCQACGKHLEKGTCIRCGTPAVNEESFSCGKACA